MSGCLYDDAAPQFTGKERDTETGLDYFGARYYGSNMGRFMTPDPLMASAHVANPQTWNRYTYTLNNPLRFVDPDGMDVPKKCTEDPSCKITLRINVIYDKKANNGKGLTDKQKQQFEKKQLEDAKKRYGVANINIQATYTQGSWSKDNKGNIHIDGAQKDSLNVVVSDTSPDNVSGISGNNPAGIIINVNEMHNFDLFPVGTRTLPHEMAHHMLDHVQRNPGGFFDYLIREFSADSFAAGVGDPQTAYGYRNATQNKSYAVPTNPEAVKPKTE